MLLDTTAALNVKLTKTIVFCCLYLQSIELSHKICLFLQNSCIFVEFSKIRYWPMTIFIFQLKFNFAKLSEKNTNLFKLSDNFIRKFHCHVKKCHY